MSSGLLPIQWLENWLVSRSIPDEDPIEELWVGKVIQLFRLLLKFP